MEATDKIKNKYELSLVVPCYNESKGLKEAMGRLIDHMDNIPLRYELILVNDGSRDNTADIMTEIQEIYGEDVVKIINYEKNRGKGYAVRLGLTDALGENIIFMDADLSTDLSHITEFVELLQKHNVVIGSRKMPGCLIEKKQTPFRVFLGKTAKIVTSTIVDLDFYDTQCGFKGFRNEVAKAILPDLTIDRFCFDVEMLYVAKLKGYGFKETPVIWRNREESTVNPIRDGLKFTSDLIKIRKTHKGGI